MKYPVRPALAKPGPVIPTGPDWWYEPKVDGHRTVMRRTDDTVILYARSGRVVTSHWMDLAVAGMALRPGTTLDGEAVIWRDGRIDFGAAQARAASGIARAQALAAQHPASYLAWDVLEHPDHGQTTALPYTERRQLLVDLLHDVQPPSRPSPPPTTERSPRPGTTPSRPRASRESSQRRAAPRTRPGAAGPRCATPTPKTPWSSDTSGPGTGPTGSRSPSETKVRRSGSRPA